MDTKVKLQFKNPGSEFRGKPFWAWNGKLDTIELRRQIRLMKAMGLGGFFMHARVGLNTPYLDKEWFACVDACIDEAKRQGMEAWLYDEDRWPSGAAGGLVTKKKAYRARSIHFNKYEGKSHITVTPSTLALFRVQWENGKIIHSERLPKRTVKAVIPEGFSILTFEIRLQPESSWYNGFTYLDTLNPQAVKAFIKVTHEAYRKRYGDDFGKVIPGIFTDEPELGAKFNNSNDPSLPWTDRLPIVFRQKYGYEILDHLPELFFGNSIKATSRTRYHFHDCLTHLFVNAFSKTIGDWCEKNGLLFTGHVMEEDSPSIQNRFVGSAMRFYEYMQAPGIDLLTERWRIYDTAKQVSSMARQFGRKWRLTETYGCTGWDFPLEGHKALSDWQAALGINLRCQHLYWHTMLGEAKRDYPAAISHQSPWWRQYSTVENYCARINAVMTQGKEVRNILVIHPVESTWINTEINMPQRGEVTEIDKALIELRDRLLCAGLDFDYGDEEVLSRHGSVRKGKEGVRFRINLAEYKVVVVPKIDTIRKSTVDLLRRFKKAGGTVVFAYAAPLMVDALESEEASKLANECVCTNGMEDQLIEACEEGRLLSFYEPSGNRAEALLSLLREDKEAWYLFVCNTGLKREQMLLHPRDQDRVCDRQVVYPEVRIKLTVPLDGVPEEWDPATGEIFCANSVVEENHVEISTNFHRIGSRLFVFPKKKGGTHPRRPLLTTVKEIELAPDKWSYRLSEANVLVLDHPRFSIGNTTYKAAEEILRIDNIVREALGVSRRVGHMVQPWAMEKALNPKKVPVKLSYTFEIKEIPSGRLFLGMEQPEFFSATLNGHSIVMDALDGFWVDKSLKKISIDNMLLRRGSNILELFLEYDEGFSGLEAIYLLGEFGVSVDRWETTITKLPNQLVLGDFCMQGLPFYAGSVLYETKLEASINEGERAVLSVSDFRGTAIRIFINDTEKAIIAWPPYEADITDLLISGTNRIGIEVVGHRRNSHGPHHLKHKWPTWTGPNSFRAIGEEWFEGYNLVPAGLMKASVVIKI